MSYNENEKIMHEITPKFNFIYELGMPTGKKIKRTILLFLIFLCGLVVVSISKSHIDFAKELGKYNIVAIIDTILIGGMVFSLVKLLVHIFLQSSQYDNIKFTFYETHMIYEDKFLNQHRKNIEYQNIKEVEIRRKVWDRILGFGIIIIYTNAENDYSNGLVIFSIKDAEKHYEIIDKLVHSRKENMSTNDVNQDNNLPENKVTNNIQQPSDNELNETTQEEFLESLKKIEK